MENDLLGNIIAEVCSGSLGKSNMKLSVKIVVNLWKSLTCVEKTSILDIEKSPYPSIFGQKYSNKAFLVPNLGIFVTSQNFGIKLIWRCWFQIWQ